MKVFVYGTLKKGYSNHGYLLSSKFIGKAYSKNTYTLFNCGFPMAYLNPKGYPIAGELYEVPEKTIERSIDPLEGNGYFYTRHEREFIKEEEVVTSWIYEIPKLPTYSKELCKFNADGHYEWKP